MRTPALLALLIEFAKLLAEPFGMAWRYLIGEDIYERYQRDRDVLVAAIGEDGLNDLLRQAWSAGWRL